MRNLLNLLIQTTSQQIIKINTKNPNQTICLPKNKIDSIEFVTAIFFTIEDQKAYTALKNNEEKLRIIWELQRSLLEINLEYEVKPNFDNLESIILKKQYILIILVKTSLWIQYLLYKEVFIQLN